MTDVGKSKLLRKLTSKSHSKKQSQGKNATSPKIGTSIRDAPERMPLSSFQPRAPLAPLVVPDLSQADSTTLATEAPKNKTPTVYVGSQEVPLSTLLLVLGPLLVLFILWRAFVEWSDTIIRLVVMGIVGTAALLLSPLKDQLQSTSAG
jgi:hypothetical protein